LTPEQYVAVPTDFGPGRSKLFGNNAKSMTKSSGWSTMRVLALSAVILTATSWAQNRPPVVEKLAKTYGLDSFGQIEAIRYTFNLDLPGLKLSRSWEWEPVGRGKK
jgi:hypothetical protein